MREADNAYMRTQRHPPSAGRTKSMRSGMAPQQRNSMKAPLLVTRVETARTIVLALVGLVLAVNRLLCALTRTFFVVAALLGASGLLLR